MAKLVVESHSLGKGSPPPSSTGEKKEENDSKDAQVVQAKALRASMDGDVKALKQLLDAGGGGGPAEKTDSELPGT